MNNLGALCISGRKIQYTVLLVQNTTWNSPQLKSMFFGVLDFPISETKAKCKCPNHRAISK